MKITKEWFTDAHVAEYFNTLTKGTSSPIEVSELLGLLHFLKVSDKFDVGIDRHKFAELLTHLCDRCEVSDERYIKLLCRLAAAEVDMVTNSTLASWLSAPNMDGWFDTPDSEAQDQIDKVLKLVRNEPHICPKSGCLPKLGYRPLWSMLRALDHALTRLGSGSNKFDLSVISYSISRPRMNTVLLHDALIEFFDGLELYVPPTKVTLTQRLAEQANMTEAERRAQDKKVRMTKRVPRKHKLVKAK